MRSENNPAIIIPAYQPDQKLLLLVQELRQQRPDQLIIVVNDGSDPEKNNIFEELANYQVKVLCHPKNRGKGQALKTAFSYYLQNSQERAVGVVTADADGQHLAQNILMLSDALVNEQTDLHLGVRDFSKQEIPWRSKLGNLLTRYIFQKMCAINIIDTQTGLRAIPCSLIKTSLNSQYSGYEFEMEMLLLASRNQIKINQIPIKTIYYDKNQQSHFKPFSDSLKIYRVVFTFLLSSKKYQQPL